MRGMSTLPPQEALHKELLADPGPRARLEDAVRANEWAPNYHAHEVVRSSDAGTVLPVALYIDGVPFAKRDGMIGFHVVNMVSGDKHVVCSAEEVGELPVWVQRLVHVTCSL